MLKQVVELAKQLFSLGRETSADQYTAPTIGSYSGVMPPPSTSGREDPSHER
jgi:hypothetical protein